MTYINKFNVEMKPVTFRMTEDERSQLKILCATYNTTVQELLYSTVKSLLEEIEGWNKND